MRKFTPLALVCGLCLIPLGCDSVEEEHGETIDEIDDAGAYVDSEEAEDINEEVGETNEQMLEEMDGDVDAVDGLGDGEVDLDPGVGNDIGAEDGIGDPDLPEPVAGSDL